MIKIQKIDKEYQLLLEHYKNAQSQLIRDRAHCMILSMQGRSSPDIATILIRREETIRDWVKNYTSNRLTSISPQYSGNTNASKLTPEQLKEIVRAIQAPPDTEGGLPTHFWSVGRLKPYLQAEYGVVYESERSYHHLFAISHYSFKLPHRV